MDSSRQSEVSPEAMQARIQQARREAETLKDRIKRKKDELADTTCEYFLANFHHLPSPQMKSRHSPMPVGVELPLDGPGHSPIEALF